MLDEADVRRLAEMGIDVYVPRAAARSQVVSPQPAQSRQAGSASVVVLAEIRSPAAKSLIAAVSRGLAFARVGHIVLETADEASLSDATGLVVFGEALARKAGAVLPAPRQQAIAWVHAADAAALAGDAHAKRALWSELKRMRRALT